VTYDAASGVLIASAEEEAVFWINTVWHHQNSIQIHINYVKQTAYIPCCCMDNSVAGDAVKIRSSSTENHEYLL
jgi:hypothetical protein